MAVSHVFSNAVGDFTGTVTVFNSQASTTTTAATNLVRPVDWNSAHNQFYTLSGNTNNASTVSATNVVLQGIGQVSLVGSTATLGISLAAGTDTFWQPYNEARPIVLGQSAGTLHIAPVPTPPTAYMGQLEIDRVAMPLLVSNNTNSTGSVTLSKWFGLYTKNASTLSVAYSTSQSTNWTFSGSNSASLQQGLRLFTIPWTTTIQDGRYWVAVIYRSTSGGANCTLSPVFMSQIDSNFSGVMGEAATRFAQLVLGLGVYSASTSGLPDSIALTQIDGTISIALRQPMWFAISGTV